MTAPPATTLVEFDFGHWQMVTTYGFDEDGRACMGGYAIHYDRDGMEIGRTENQWNLRMTVQ